MHPWASDLFAGYSIPLVINTDQVCITLKSRVATNSNLNSSTSVKYHFFYIYHWDAPAISFRTGVLRLWPNYSAMLVGIITLTITSLCFVYDGSIRAVRKPSNPII